MRRRRLVFLVLFLLVLAAAVVFVAIQQVPPPVTEKPRPPAPPPRPLQADAEGYYEPGYQFSLSGLQFTRLTLHPETYVTFVRSGTRHEAGCVDRVIRTDRVQRRCNRGRVGTVTGHDTFTYRQRSARRHRHSLA